jgi:hypothetical protein
MLLSVAPGAIVMLTAQQQQHWQQADNSGCDNSLLTYAVHSTATVVVQPADSDSVQHFTCHT